MTSFTVKPNGTIKVKPKGKIQFYFKNMQMHPDRATVVLKEDNLLTVARDEDGQLFNFKSVKGRWLLKTALTKNNPLYGTRFIFES